MILPSQEICLVDEHFQKFWFCVPFILWTKNFYFQFFHSWKEIKKTIFTCLYWKCATFFPPFHFRYLEYILKIYGKIKLGSTWNLLIESNISDLNCILCMFLGQIQMHFRIFLQIKFKNENKKRRNNFFYVQIEFTIVRNSEKTLYLYFTLFRISRVRERERKRANEKRDKERNINSRISIYQEKDWNKFC